MRHRPGGGARVEAVTITDRAELEQFLQQHTTANFLQSWQWGELHESLGNTVVRSGIRQDTALVGAWSGIVKDAKRGRYLEIPGGPVIDWTNTPLVEAVMQQVRQIAKSHRCVFVRLRPPVEQSQQVTQLLKHVGAQKAPMHLHAEHTSILDITPDKDAILAGMRRQTRYEVRRVAKRELTVSSKTPTDKDIDEFYDVQAATAHRHGFVQSSRGFIQAMRRSFGDQLQLYRAEKDGRLLNLALVIHYGEESDYFEAASTSEARQEPGAYGIVWQAIQDAKAAGSTRFNFWGIAYSDDPNHRYAGVTTFKRGFGGQDVEYAPAHDIVINSAKYQVNWLVETIRRKKRGL